MRSSLAVWRDRRGRLSALRVVTLAYLLLPIGLALAAAFTEERFGARPVNDLIHRAGFWTLVFLLTSLAVTPFARIGRYGGLLDVRRMLGVGAFCYAVVHILLYITDQAFDLGKVGSEIVLRLYLTIGFTALIGLLALAATSTDGMLRDLGTARWARLHQLVYLIAALALVHYFQQTKADVSVPTFVAGLLVWLMGYRIAVKIWKPKGNFTPWALLALTVAATLTTMLGEAIGIAISFDVSPLLVLQMDYNFDLETIPAGWFVFGAGLCVVALDIVRAWWRKPRAPAAVGSARATAPVGKRAREPA
jgi:sulfoxide reductase heme-binding subunit YedZ